MRRGHCNRIYRQVIIKFSEVKAERILKASKENQWPGMVVHACKFSYSGGGGRKIASLSQARQSYRDPVSSKTKQKHKGWVHSSGGRMFA
jgi:hypothetical protein